MDWTSIICAVVALLGTAVGGDDSGILTTTEITE